jgi:hypothetical protein
MAAAARWRWDSNTILARAAEIVEEHDTALTSRKVHNRFVAEAETSGSRCSRSWSC